jgi:ribonucleotide reductase beta subunit family protein with ferritin-like domain
MEPLLAEVSNRFVLFPIRYNAIWKMYKKAVSAFWTTEEIDVSKDYDDWVKLNETEQHYIKNILAFFAGSDGIVNENLGVRFMNEISCQEGKCFYGFQIAMENIHCVAGFTWIMTSKGYFKIKDLESTVVEVWNGEEWSKTMVMKTHDAADAMIVRLSNGATIVCTPNHKWLIGNPGEDRVMTQDLKVGMQITPFVYPVCDFDEQELFSNPGLHGEYAGGNVGDKELPYNPIKFNCRYREFVPINFSIDTRVKWIKGFLKNAKVQSDGSGVIRNTSDDTFKANVQLLFSTLNIFVLVNDEGITIPSDCMRRDDIMGDCDTATNIPILVSEVMNVPGKMPMYCFEEPLRNTGIFNGILTGQSETYSLLLDTYIKDTEEKKHLLNAINTIPCITKKAEWAMKWISDENASFATRLVAFACVEGIFFSGAFCSIFWLKERGILPGLTLSNEFISRDESLHTEFAILLYNHLEYTKLTKEEIEKIVTEAVTIEDEFINDSISCNMLGMNRELMSQYIKFVADRLVIQLGYEPIYGCSNPFHFMDRISLSNKTNFFEHTRQSEYALARVGNEKGADTFSLDAEF